MVTQKTAAMVVAIAAIAVLGTLAAVGNQAVVFAQVTNNNNANLGQTGTVTCSPTENRVGFQVAVNTCWNDFEMGNCQVAVGADDFSEASSDFQSEDCS